MNRRLPLQEPLQSRSETSASESQGSLRTAQPHGGAGGHHVRVCGHAEIGGGSWIVHTVIVSSVRHTKDKALASLHENTGTTSAAGSWPRCSMREMSTHPAGVSVRVLGAPQARGQMLGVQPQPRLLHAGTWSSWTSIRLSVHPPPASHPGNARITDTSVQPGVQQTLSAQYRAAIVISQVSRPDTPVSWLLETYLVCGGSCFKTGFCGRTQASAGESRCAAPWWWEVDTAP